MTRSFDVSPFLSQDEGQHFERKSLFEGEPGKKRPRDRRIVRDEVAENVAAFANAEGGVLILGIEDDGTVTGHRLPRDAVEALLETPRNRLSPPQAPGFAVAHEGHELLVFEVGISDVPVHVEGDGFPLRIGESSRQVPETKIQQLKLAGLVESWESRPSRLGLDGLDAALVARARRGAGLEALSDEDYLLSRKLADRKGAGLILRRAAELLFASHGPDHANAGVRVFRVVGTERRVGAGHNVEERPRIEGPLPVVLDGVFREVGGLLRRPSRLVGTKFRETPEYPEFSWKEAVLNAVAHRDYAIEGRCIEVWLFDDRMEVVSPGGLLPDVTVELLAAMTRTHVSRNPRIARVLVDLGYMRDQGEGIPRMFAEMEGMFLPAPVLEADARQLNLTLRNTPVFSAADRAFIAALGSEELTDQEFRALFEAHRHGRVDNARLRAVAGLDTLGASAILRRLRERHLLESRLAGSATFYELTSRPPQASGASDPAGDPTASSDGMDRGETSLDRGENRPSSAGESLDRGEMGRDRGENGPPEARVQGGGQPPPGSGLDEEEAIAAIVHGLGPKPRTPKLREAIVRLVELRAMRAAELAQALGLADVEKLVERHLSPMVVEGLLERTHPDVPTHRDQAYRAAQRKLDL